MTEQSKSTMASPGMTPSPVLELRGIEKSFAAVRALKGVSFAAAPGEVHAIVGENGAGKSTLIGIAAGVLPRDAGEILCNGQTVAAPSARGMRDLGVSVAYQHPALATDLTVLENLQLVADDLRQSGGPAEATRLIRLVATEQLEMKLDQRIGDLTLAQRHVVEIVRALATKPKVLFLDEPTEPFQQADIRKLFDLIKALRQQGVAIVYVSHRLHEVTEQADRITVIRDGEMVDTRPARDFTMTDIVTRIAGRPLAQMFPPKSSKVGAPQLEVQAMSGAGFDAVNLTVRAGEIVGLAGVEGEGQREFLRAVAGVDRRAQGQITVAGTAVQGQGPHAARAAGMGFVTDDRHSEGLFLGLSVRENLGLGFLGKVAAGGIIDRGKRSRSARPSPNSCASARPLWKRRSPASRAATSKRFCSAAKSPPSRRCCWSMNPPRASMSAPARKSISACGLWPIRAWPCWCRRPTGWNSKGFATASSSSRAARSCVNSPAPTSPTRRSPKPT